jgi:hypothetical protein
MRDDCRGVSKRESFPTDTVFVHLPQATDTQEFVHSTYASPQFAHAASATTSTPHGTMHTDLPFGQGRHLAATLHETGRPMLEHPPDLASGARRPLRSGQTRQTRNHWHSMRTGDTVHTKDAFSRLALPGNHATCTFAFGWHHVLRADQQKSDCSPRGTLEEEERGGEAGKRPSALKS